MKRLIIVLALLLGLAGQVCAQTPSKNYLKEPSTWFNAGGAAADVITSAVVIDGKHVKEGNPIFRAKNGTVNWGRAAVGKGIALAVPAILYRFNPDLGRKANWVMGSVQFGVAAGNVYVGFKYRW